MNNYRESEADKYELIKKIKTKLTKDYISND